jgi:hypothetical protein
MRLVFRSPDRAIPRRNDEGAKAEYEDGFSYLYFHLSSRSSGSGTGPGANGKGEGYDGVSVGASGGGVCLYQSQCEKAGD